MRRMLNTRLLLPVTLTALACLNANSQRQVSGARPASTASGVARLQFLSINDPYYGVEKGKLPFFAGWQGNVGITRDDPGCPDCNSFSLKMTSPDGRSQIQTFSPALYTRTTPIPGQKGHFVRTRFTSAGSLLVQDIVPGLDLHGQVSAPRPALAHQAAAMLTDIKRFSQSGSPFTQGAAVTVTGTGSDYVVEGITFGGYLGMPAEFTITHFTVIQAPAGQAEALARDWENLVPMTINPEWQRLDDDHTVATIKRLQAQGQQQTAQMQQFMRDYNAKQARVNQRELDSNKTARDAQQNRANQSLVNSQQNQRNITDTGTLVNDSRSGNSHYYTFCNNVTGQVAYQLDNTAPPDASGQWHRCGN